MVQRLHLNMGRAGWCWRLWCGSRRFSCSCRQALLDVRRRASFLSFNLLYWQLTGFWLHRLYWLCRSCLLRWVKRLLAVEPPTI